MEIKQEKKQQKKNNHTSSKKTKTNKQLRSPAALCSSFASLWIPDSFCSLRRATHASTQQSLIRVCRHRPNRWSAANDKIRKKGKKKKKATTLTVKLFKPFKAPPGGNGPVCVLFVSKSPLWQSWNRDGAGWKQLSVQLWCVCRRYSPRRARPVHQPERHLFCSTRKRHEKRYSAWAPDANSSIVSIGQLRLHSSECRGGR